MPFIANGGWVAKLSACGLKTMNLNPGQYATTLTFPTGNPSQPQAPHALTLITTESIGISQK